MKRIADRWVRRGLVIWRRRGKARVQVRARALRRRAASVVGAVLLGLVALAFATTADWAQQGFDRFVQAWPLAPLVVTPIVFALVVAVTRRWAVEARGSGIPQVIAAGAAPTSAAASRLVSLATAAKKLTLTLVMLLVGGSVGREGPTVQVSAAIMVGVHKLLRVPITSGVLIAGGAAGVAAAFNTPLAGVAFAIEELAAAYEQRVAILVMGAVMISGLTSLGIAGDYVYFGTMQATLPLRAVLVVAPLAGILGGLAGGGFTRIVLPMARGEGRVARWAGLHPVVFAGLCGATVAALGVATGGQTWGTGYAATRVLVEGGDASGWFGPAKLLATLATTLSGAPGGIFAPSLAVGAGLGHLLAPVVPYASPGAVVVLGMVAYFVGVVRAPFTAIIIASEATAGRGMILPMFVTALIADATSALVCQQRLYHGLAQPFLARLSPPEEQVSAG